VAKAELDQDIDYVLFFFREGVRHCTEAHSRLICQDLSHKTQDTSAKIQQHHTYNPQVYQAQQYIFTRVAQEGTQRSAQLLKTIGTP